MPQVQLPIFPAGVTHINSEVAFEEREGKVYYFNGHLPVFVHEKGALATFRLFSTQLVINGNATQAEISRAFGVPLVTVKTLCEALPASWSGGFLCACQEAIGQQSNGGSFSTGPRLIGPRADAAGSRSATGDLA